MDPDLKFILDGDIDSAPTEIFVWHQIMANASPFFRVMLAPDRFVEGVAMRQDGYLEITLPDTDPNAMQVICDILHLRSSKIPMADLTSERLLAIAVLVDKFDCAEAIQPWSLRWLGQGHIRDEMAAVEEMSPQDLSKWICICHALGYSELSRKHASRLTRSTSDSDWLRENGEHLIQLTPLLTERIKAKRVMVADRFREIVVDLVRRVEQGKSCRFHDASTEEEEFFDHMEISENESFDCASIQLGNVLLAIRGTLDESWRSEPWTGSIASMYVLMRNIADKMVGPSRVVRGSLGYSRRKASLLTHASCSSQNTFQNQFEQVMEELQTSLDNDFIDSHSNVIGPQEDRL